MNLTLVEPSIEYQNSYVRHVEECREHDTALVPFVLQIPCADFNAFIRELRGYSEGQNLNPGFVPNSTFWLLEDRAEVVGVSNIRHRLTDKLRVEGGHIGYGIRPSRRGRGYGNAILEKSLTEAKKLGIEKVLVTCGKDNTPSARTILRNGGVLESEQYVPERQTIVQRYWIELK